MSLRARICRSLSVFGGVGALLLAGMHASGQAVVTRVIGPQPWRPANGESDSVWFPERNEMAISSDDRWVVFESGANNLAPYDRNPYADIFVYEVATGRIHCITSNANFNASASSYDPAISANGRFVVFASNASNLVANDTNDNSDVFFVDRDPDGNGIFDEQPYAFERISVDAGGNETHGACNSPSISDDGSWVLFLSDASDLVRYDNNGANDAFLRDRWYGTTERVDVDSSGNEANNGCSYADLSADGNVVAFCSYSDNLVASDTNREPDVFVIDLSTLVTERVNVGTRGRQANARSFVFRHCLSADGSMVAFQSDASNLDADANGCGDVFVRDRQGLVTMLVSVDSNWTQGNGESGQPTISADGTRITFVSFADNLAAGDGNGNQDVFLRDLNAGTTTLLSPTAGGGATANGSSGAATSSPDGKLVVLSSTASDLVSMGDVAGFRDVFLSDLSNGSIAYVTALPAGDPNGPSAQTIGAFDFPPSITPDGRLVAFYSDATNLVASDNNGSSDVFVADQTTGAVVRVSISSTGAEANGPSWSADISSDGRFVTFGSIATNLVATDANGALEDVFLHDRDPDGNGIFDEGNGTTTLVSVDSSGVQANDGSDWPSISADGNRIAFHTTSNNLTPGDTNGCFDIFVRDVAAGSTVIASVRSGTTYNGDGHSTRPSISADGNAVAFHTNSDNLGGPKYPGVAVYVHRLDDGTTTWIRGMTNNDDYAYCHPHCISSDGSRVAFVHWTVIVHATGAVGIWERATSTVIETPYYSLTGATSLSANGRVATFVSLDSSVVGNDSNGTFDVFFRDVRQDASGALASFSDPVLLSQNSSGVAATGASLLTAPSADGTFISFASDAADLVANDTNGCRDVFLYHGTNVARWLNYGSGFAGPHAPPPFTCDLPPVLGSTVTLSLGNLTGSPLPALVFLSAASADVSLDWGATLLVDLPAALNLFVVVGPSGTTLSGTIPDDAALNGISIYLQALEAGDSSVPHKLMFSAGLELHLGR